MNEILSKALRSIGHSTSNNHLSSIEEQVAHYMAPRMRGQKNRQEIWYLTLSDPDRGIGLWIHHELVHPSLLHTAEMASTAPVGTSDKNIERLQGGDEALEGLMPDATRSWSTRARDDHLPTMPYAHGWIAFFEHDEEPYVERFGPDPLPAIPTDTDIPLIQGCSLTTEGARGSTATSSWDLRFEQSSRPLFTFPRWAIDYDLLPATQMLPIPSSVVTGQLTRGGRTIDLSGSRGGVAHIYGKGSAKRWAWLHADLGGGDLLEIVAAVSKTHHPPLLGPLAFVQLRVDGHDWPTNPLIASTCFRTSIGLPTWKLDGRVGLDHLSVKVTIPDRYAVTLPYTDPDGSTATCTNCEIADAYISFKRNRGLWSTAKSWTLRQSAHAEVGVRP